MFVTIESKEIVSANIIKVSAGTNCPQGGDTGHGGRTYFCIENLASTDMRVALDGRMQKSVDKIELMFGGDCEAETFIEALEFALAVLKGQSFETDQPTSSVSID